MKKIFAFLSIALLAFLFFSSTISFSRDTVGQEISFVQDVTDVSYEMSERIILEPNGLESTVIIYKYLKRKYITIYYEMGKVFENYITTSFISFIKMNPATRITLIFEPILMYSAVKVNYLRKVMMVVSAGYNYFV